MSAIISACGLYRHRLDRECCDPFPGSKVFAYFGVNPSTADASRDDATVRKWRGFTQRNNGHKFIVGNLFSYRATDVRELVNDSVDCEAVHWAHIHQIIAEADILVPCWGNSSKIPRSKRHDLSISIDHGDYTQYIDSGVELDCSLDDPKSVLRGDQP